MSLWKSLFEDDSTDKDFERFVSSRLSPAFAGLQQAVVGSFQPKFDVIRHEVRLTVLGALQYAADEADRTSCRFLLSCLACQNKMSRSRWRTID